MDILKKIKLKPIFQKGLSLLISAAIIFSVVAVGIVAAAEQTTVWDGSKDSNLEGSGTETAPYLIKTASQLAAIVTGNNGGAWTGKYFKLANDITINDTSIANWKESARNWVWADFRFIGTFDGDGHTIDGLYYKGGQRVMGLFSYVGADNSGTYQTTIKNFKMTNAYIESSAADGAGFVAAQASRVAYFEGIYIDSSCEINSTVKGAGGILGQSGYNVFMSNIAMHGTVTGGSNVGAFVGTLSSGARLDIKSSYTTADLYAQGVTDRNLATASSAVYVVKKQGTVDTAATLLTLDQMKGEAAKTNMPMLDFENVWKTVENGFPVLKTLAEEIAYWDGSKDSNLEGSGTETAPYLIKTASQLAAIVTGNNGGAWTGKYFKLANDITINDTSKANWKESALDWVWADFRFIGTFDGDGHTIDGLYYKGGQRVMGLFSYVGADNSGTYQTTIKNFKMTNAYIESSAADGAGFVAAQASRVAYFEGIYIDSSCEINSTVTGAGGILGQSGYNVFMSNIAMHGTVTGGSNVGAFAGTLSSGARLDIKSSYSTADLYAQGVTDRNLATASSAVYVVKKQGTVDAAATLLTLDQMKGEAAKTNMPGFDFDTVWKTVENGFPVLKAPQGTTPPPPANNFWDGTKASDYEGSGTEADPYLIATPEQLAYVVSTNLTDGLYFKLANDIKIHDTTDPNWKDTAKNWVWADVRFVGNFDGDGHTIDGLYFSGSQKRFGLFAFVGDTVVKNLKFTNAYIYNTVSSDAEGCAVVAGQASAKADFETIYIDDTCYVEAPNTKGVAGIVGRSDQNITITNSVVLGTFSGKSHVGAFFGTHWGSGIQTVTNSFSASNVPVMAAKALQGTANVYATVLQGTYDTGVQLLTADQMKGSAAATNMSGLDFNAVFETVDGDYPVINLRQPVLPPPIVLWDGSKDSALEGTGTETDPYLIKTPAQLAYVVSTNLTDGLYFKLANDIKINDTTAPNWKDHAKNWVWGNIRFVGNFDGDGHTIDGLYFSGTQSRFGLFSYVGDSVIKNFSLTNAYVSNGATDEGCALVAAQTQRSATFEKIYIDDTCTLIAQNVKGVAGIAARGASDVAVTVTITDCAVLANITGKSHVGAFLGTYWRSADVLSVNGCFTSANLPLSNWTLSSSANNYGTVADSYGTTVLNAEQMKGQAAAENMSGLDFDTLWQTVENDFPIINVRQAAPTPPPEPIPDYVWDGTAATEFAGGTGTAEDPFVIETPEQLYKMVKEYSTRLASLDKHFKLTADIYLNDVQDGTFVKELSNKQNWLREYGSAIATASKDNSFAGTFDGGLHTIYGLYIKNVYSAGLFPAISSGVTIKNLAIDNAYITGGSGFAGAVAGQLLYVDWHLSNKFANCSAVNAVIGENSNIQAVGGLVGNTESCSLTMQNCYTYGLTLSDQAVPGGLVGNAWSNGGNITLENCYTVGNFPVRSTLNSTKCTNVYTDTAAPTGNTTQNVTVLTTEQMKGENAKTYMSALDYVRVFKTVENGYPVHFIYVRPENVWDGNIAESFAGGTGTAEDPYLIENGGQLYKMVAEFSNRTVSDKPASRPYFKITKDIDLGYNQWYSIDLTGWIDSAAYTTIGFSGIINGDGHTITGLYNEKAAGAVGLIPVAAQGTEIHNLHLDGGKLPRVNYQTYAVGAFIGFVRGSSNSVPVVIKGCSVKNFEIAAVNGAAGFIGYAYSVSVGIYNSYCSDSAVSVTATSSANAAAFIGYTGGNDWLNTIKIANSYSADVSPIPYLNEKFSKITTFTNVYTNFDGYNNTTEGVTKLTSEQMKGENAKTYMQGFEFGFAWQTVENGYPVHMLYVKPDYVWDGGTATAFAGGSGTPTDPYLISNGAQLYKMVSEYSNASGASGTINKQYYFKLTNDIYLNDVKVLDMQNTTEAHWTSKFNSWYSQTSYSKGFCGDLDGAGFTVYGLYTNKGYAGLIPVLMDGGNIHNLNLKNSFVYGTESAGGLVGFVKAHWKMSPVSVSYCTVDNVAVESPKIYVGGLVGGCADIKVNLTDCSVTRVNLKSTNENPNYVSAFVGFGWGDIVNPVTNCFTDSTAHPVSATTNTEDFNKLAERYSFTNVYTSAAKNFTVSGLTYLDSDSKLQGANVASVLKGFDFTKDWSSRETDYPEIRKGAGTWRFDTTKPGEVWSGLVAAYYASGDGTKENPFEINTGGQLALLANDALNGKTAGRYYKITADIILNNTSFAGWESKANQWYTGTWAKAFRGYLDGGYHIISGLYLNKTKENYTGKDYYGGLFAAIGKDAVIEKLGIVNSSLTFTHDTDTKYLGTFAGFVDQYDATAAKYNEYPVIRECFADTTVYLNGGSCGGIIGCATRPVRIENSYFAGTVKDSARGVFGYSKMNNDYGVVLVKNVYVAHSKYAVVSNNSYDNFIYENCYSSSAQDKEGVTRLFIDRMCGTAAKEYMLGFDFSKIWVIGEESNTPGLKGFKKDAYNNLMAPEDITVSFETNCEITVESMTGKAYSELKLPTIEREGYIFEGWYAFAELDVPFTYDYFPTFDVILHAKWTLDGFAQDFELYENSIYDYHEGIDYYRPTSDGYSAKYVRSGAKAMHRLGDGGDYRDFLLFYNEELEIGKTYKMVFYTTTDAEKASTTVSLVHLNWPDVYSDNAGIETMGEIDSLTDGKWVENTYTFVAKSKWLAIRTEGEGSIYFDDFTLFNTTEKPGGLVSGNGFFSSLWVIVTVIGLAVLLLGAGATVFFVVRAKKNK